MISLSSYSLFSSSSFISIVALICASWSASICKAELLFPPPLPDIAAAPLLHVQLFREFNDLRLSVR